MQTKRNPQSQSWIGIDTSMSFKPKHEDEKHVWLNFRKGDGSTGIQCKLFFFFFTPLALKRNCVVLKESSFNECDMSGRQRNELLLVWAEFQRGLGPFSL